MQLSVIIVNYNVRFFLEQCLYSVQEALQGLAAEIIVTDNHSDDGSREYLPHRFENVRFIFNDQNLGFAKACNQGLAASSGKYILFLNPDTILPEDGLKKCIAFLDAHPDAGAVGVKMLDGSGRFLKESKRSFPSPLTSLYKLFGLSRLFPRSKIFARYHLGYLSENETNEVQVLAGAFMMIRREVLEQLGGFDENFFMYGEDIDLSYRVQQAGYRNYYFADVQIIHFKGESTRRGSMNYVRMFYSAMSRFVKKHYGGSKAGFFLLMMHAGIWFRAILTATGNFIRRIGLPLIDAGMILLSFWLVKYFWNQFVKTETLYNNRLLWIAFASLTLVFSLSNYYIGLYDRWYKFSRLLKAFVAATFVLLAAYSLLPEQYRFSRAILVFGAILSFVLIGLLRWILVRAGVLTSYREKTDNATMLVAGTQEEQEEVLELLKQSGMQQKVLTGIAPDAGDEAGTPVFPKRISSLLHTIPVREIIFCRGWLSYTEIIRQITQMPKTLRAKIHAAGSGSIVGSHAKNISGESFSAENGYRLSDPLHRRQKRLLDVCVAGLGLFSFPLQFLLVQKPIPFFVNCIRILIVKKTWVGYGSDAPGLPVLPAAVLTGAGFPVSVVAKLQSTDERKTVDVWYARRYHPLNDLRLLLRHYRKLGG